MSLGFILKAVLRALLAFAALYGAVPASADSGIVGVPVNVCIARDTGGDARAMLAAPGRFDCKTPQVDFGPGDFWALSGPLPADTGRTPLRVRIASLWQSEVTLNAIYADGRIASFPIDGHATARHMQLGAIIEQAVPVREIPVVRLLWHIEGSANLRGILIGARIASPEDSARANMIFGMLYAGFAGLCIALIVYNLALWGALRHGFQLAYCGMVAGLLVYAFSSSGALAWVWPGLANTDRLRINYLTLAFAAAMALVFARSFFEPHIFAGWLDRAVKAIVVALIAVGLLFAAAAPWHVVLLDRLYGGVFLIELAFVPPLLWQAWRRRSNYLWLFALAWAAPISLAALRVANTFHLIQYSFWLDNSTLGSMSLEALLSSLAIAYRIHLIAQERDEAREQEIAARLLADTDPLTGLLNRRAFLRHAIGLAGDQTLIVVDIDHFKRVNETIGHDGGDEVLRVFARALRFAVPPGTLIARIGGEEFAIVVDSGSDTLPATVLQRLRAERMPFDMIVTASIGSCTGPLLRETDWKTLYRAADQALFEAKAAGRDRSHTGKPLAIAA